MRKLATIKTIDKLEPIEGADRIDEVKFTDVEDYVGKQVECEVIVWDYRQKRTSDRYKVIGLA